MCTVGWNCWRRTNYFWFTATDRLFFSRTTRRQFDDKCSAAFWSLTDFFIEEQRLAEARLHNDNEIWDDTIAHQVRRGVLTGRAKVVECSLSSCQTSNDFPMTGAGLSVTEDVFQICFTHEISSKWKLLSRCHGLCFSLTTSLMMG